MARILLIEDDAVERQTLESLLKSAGYEVTLAADGWAGVRLFRANPADLIITDVVMPYQDEIETIVGLRKEFPTTPLVALSSLSPKEAVVLAAKYLGASSVLQKPFMSEELLDAVRQALSFTVQARTDNTKADSRYV